VRAVSLLLLVAVFGLAGCGAVDDAKEEANKKIAQIKDKAQEIKKDLDKLRGKVENKVNDALADIRNVLPKADEDTPVPAVRLALNPKDPLEDLERSVADYWAATLKASDLPAPRVKHIFIARGASIPTACEGDAADDYAAFYCPLDDTIYVGRRLVQDVLEGTGDFGVAYVVAHEYAHNIQSELGWFDEGVAVTTVAPFELQADCMAGTWAWAVYEQGRVEPGDVEEAVATALAVGDFDYTNPQHHGTPDERREAWLRGYSSGDPSTCRRYTTG
jgi:hypothetical protein